MEILPFTWRIVVVAVLFVVLKWPVGPKCSSCLANGVASCIVVLKQSVGFEFHLDSFFVAFKDFGLLVSLLYRIYTLYNVDWVLDYSGSGCRIKVICQLNCFSAYTGYSIWSCIVILRHLLRCHVVCRRIANQVELLVLKLSLSTRDAF